MHVRRHGGRRYHKTAFLFLAKFGNSPLCARRANPNLLMLTRELDFDLPPELIAQTPIEPRDAARLLHLNCATGALTHHVVRDLPDLLRAGDLLVLNDTRVLRARLHGQKPSGGRVEALLLKEERADARGADVWEALLKPSGRLQIGGELWFRGQENGRQIVARAQLLERREAAWLLQFSCDDGRPLRELLPVLGEVPLPPYIHERADEARYQTTFARQNPTENPLDSAAAPTAGLHFTPELLQRLENRGIERVFITLAVGAGTFRPVKVENLDEHSMHAEEFWIAPAVAARINAHKAAGGRVVAVGTTTVRALESAARASKDNVARDDAPNSSHVAAGAGETRLFLQPGAPFYIVDALMTNFHLPRSTLLALVAALVQNKRARALNALAKSEKSANGENSSTDTAVSGIGLSMTQRAYREAVNCRYRFFSFGDAMLIE